jgi:TPR repeat protein
MFGTYKLLDHSNDRRWGRVVPGPASYLPAFSLTPRAHSGLRTGAVLIALAACGAAWWLKSEAPSPDQDLAVLRHNAAEGEAGAQLLLGLAYRDGRYGLKPDTGQALAWITRAAEDGKGDEQAYARDLAGRMRESRTPAATSPGSETGLHRLAAATHSTWLKLVAAVTDLFAITDTGRQSGTALQQRAAQGDAIAQYQLALRYQTGAFGVQQDSAQALRWLESAADNGNRLAMKRLAEVYARGELGARPDPVRSERWRQRAQAAAG